MTGSKVYPGSSRASSCSAAMDAQTSRDSPWRSGLGGARGSSARWNSSRRRKLAVGRGSSCHSRFRASVCFELTLISHFKRGTADLGIEIRHPGRLYTRASWEGETATVLVVDDDPQARSGQPGLGGYRVVEAESVESAHAALDAESIDAVLLDVHLGNDDGLLLLPTIEEDGPAVALLTGGPGVHLPDGATDQQAVLDRRARRAPSANWSVAGSSLG